MVWAAWEGAHWDRQCSPEQRWTQGVCACVCVCVVCEHACGVLCCAVHVCVCRGRAQCCPTHSHLQLPRAQVQIEATLEPLPDEPWVGRHFSQAVVFLWEEVLLPIFWIRLLPLCHLDNSKHNRAPGAHMHVCTCCMTAQYTTPPHVICNRVICCVLLTSSSVGRYSGGGLYDSS